MKTMIMAGLLMATSAFAGTYELDKSHMEVGFKVKHLMISEVKGRFNDFTGSFDFDAKAKKLEKVTVDIQVASVDTREPKRDEHLKSADFFDAAKFAKISFVGEKTEFKGDKPVKISGKLTIRDVTKPVTLELEYRGTQKDPWGNERVGFKATTKIKRSDFGVKWNKDLDTGKAGDVVVGEDVTIEIDGEAILKK